MPKTGLFDRAGQMENFMRACRFSGSFLGRGFLFFLVSGVLLFCSALWAQQGDSSHDRYRVFSLKHVPPRIAKEFLDNAEVGDVSQLGGANTLLVTSGREGLERASAIISVIDSPERHVWREILPASVYVEPQELREYLRDVAIGTFSQAPRTGVENRILLDIHGDSVVAVAPAGMIDEIVQAISRANRELDEKTREAEEADGPDESADASDEQAVEDVEADDQEAEAEAVVIDEDIADEPVDIEADDATDLFDKLLGQLTAAEQEAADRRIIEDEAVAEGEDLPDSAEIAEADPALAEILAQLQQESQQQVDPEYEQQQQEIEKRLVQAEAEVVEAEHEQQLEEDEQAGFEIAEDIAEPVPTSYRPRLDPDVDEDLRLRLPEEIQIVDLISLVGEYFDIDYMYDPRQITGTVKLNLRGPVRVGELYPLLESALKFRNFVMTRQGNMVIVVPQGEVMNIDPRIINEGDSTEFGDVTVSRVFDLRHVSAQDAQSFLQTMRVSENINATTAGKLIVTGYAFRMPRIEQLLSLIDVPGRPREFRQRTLRYTLAENLTPRIERLASQLDTVSVEVGAVSTDPRERALQARRAAEGRDSQTASRAGDTVFLDADERTNRILMIGTAGKLDIVEDIIDSLDVRKQDLRQIRVYEIMNVTAEDVQDKLSQLGLISTGGAAQRQRQQQEVRAQRAAESSSESGPIAITEEGIAEEPQVVVLETTNSLLVNATVEQHTEIAMIIGYVDNETQREQVPYRLYPLENNPPEDVAATLNELVQATLQDLEDKIEVSTRDRESIAIIPDESTFSVIVYASRRNQEWIGDLIAQLDRRRPQVLIDVTLVEIRRTEEFQYDLEVLGNLERSVTGNILGGTSLPFETTGRHLEGGWHRGEIRGFYGSDRIQMLLQAMERKGYGRVLAKPQILVNDNEEGTISTVDRRYVRESTVTVPGEGRPVESVTFNPYDATIELAITPTISEGDLLRLAINLRREDFVGTGADGAPPDQLTSNVNTIVTVPDQKTIILGGLIRLTQDKRGRKVPILGDLPLLGGLFRSIDNSDDESKLYVFVQAHILRPDERLEGLPELENISDRLRRSFEESEAQFQKYEQWPGIEPTPMSPERVLEEH